MLSDITIIMWFSWTSFLKHKMTGDCFFSKFLRPGKDGNIWCVCVCACVCACTCVCVCVCACACACPCVCFFVGVFQTFVLELFRRGVDRTLCIFYNLNPRNWGFLAFDFLSDLRAFRADSIQFPKTGKWPHDGEIDKDKIETTGWVCQERYSQKDSLIFRHRNLFSIIICNQFFGVEERKMPWKKRQFRAGNKWIE